MIDVVFQEPLLEHIHDSILEHVPSTSGGTSAVEDQSPKAQSLTSLWS